LQSHHQTQFGDTSSKKRLHTGSLKDTFKKSQGAEDRETLCKWKIKTREVLSKLNAASAEECWVKR
jgi:hypothetical protein